MADKELTFWDHLDELRRVLFRILGVWFVLAVGYFIAMPYLFDNVVLAPCHNDFIFYDLLRYIGEVFDLHDEFFTQEFQIKLININLAAPLTLRFLSTYQLSATIENQISLNSYIDNFMMLVLCMGLAFELPLVTWLLSLLGLVHKTFLRKYRRHAVVIIVIVAAVITPTGDPFTLTVVAVPLYLLYEMSILMIKDKKADETEEIIETGER